MKTYVHLWQSLIEFLQREMFHIKVVQRIKTHILCSITFPPKSCRLGHTVGKCDRVTQATDGNIVQRMRFACWIPKPTETHSEYVILIVFPRQQRLRERTSMLRNQCITCLVCSDSHGKHKYPSSSSIGTATLVLACSTIVEYSQQEGFYRVPLPAARQTPPVWKTSD